MPGLRTPNSGVPLRTFQLDDPCSDSDWIEEGFCPSRSYLLTRDVSRGSFGASPGSCHKEVPTRHKRRVPARFNYQTSVPGSNPMARSPIINSQNVAFPRRLILAISASRGTTELSRHRKLWRVTEVGGE